MTLFEDYHYFQYKFPEPQYLGAKYILLSWINTFIPANIKVGIDAFAGTQSVAFLLKQRGIKVITNDLLKANHQIGLSLIENKTEKPSKLLIERYFEPNENKNKYSLIEDTFTDIFFERKEAFFLDNFRANIDLIENKYQKAIAFTLLNRSLQRKITMGHFGHSQALNYARDKERIKRNPNLARPVKDILLDLLPYYNQAIFDNQQENKSYCENILTLLPKLLTTEKIDFAYFDPPYCDSHADYQSFYHLTETVTEYWRDKQFVNSIKRYEPQRFSGFDKKREVISSFEKLFEMSQDIPHWLISYNDRSYPSVSELAKMIAKYKQVSVETKTYLNGRGGKGSVAGSQEILFVCKYKPIFNIPFFMQLQSFNYWKDLYESDKLEEFNFNLYGLLWLKIKSITRKEMLEDFIKKQNISLQETTLNAQFIELYEKMSQEITVSHELIDTFIRDKNKIQFTELDTEKLVSELYKLRHFDWGGDYKNALDRFLVDKYVKTSQNYDDLVAKFDTEIQRAVQGYVLCSWYNDWTSILIEHLFKKHLSVLPTVGQIKKVDFFVNGIPFDLKVTYLPANFIEQKRKEKGLKPELTELKQKAKEAGILFTNHSRTDDIYYEIIEKMKDKNDDFCKQSLQNIKNIRLEILKEVQENPKILAQNLYEQQGELRFDASNRLFLVLVDTEDFDNSWKLKRNMSLLKPCIEAYLDNFGSKNIDDLKITFRYKNKNQVFTALSDIIFVVK